MNNQLIEYNKSLTTIKHESDLPPHISFDQYRELRNHPNINQKDRMLITLLWETGGRISDVLGLRWKNFTGLNSKDPNLKFIIQKTQRPISIPISQELATDIRQWKQFLIPNEEDFLFRGESKLGHETRQSVHKKMKRWGAMIGLPDMHAHQFRHGLIVYLLLTCGVHYKIIAARTGHTNPLMILNTYSVVTNQIQ